MRRSIFVVVLTVVSTFVAVAAGAGCTNFTPTLSISASGPDSQGNWTFAVGWSFSTNDPNFAGTVWVADDATSSLIYDNSQAPASGNYSITHNYLCRKGGTYSFTATARGCGSIEKSTTITIPSTIPTFTLSNAVVDPVTASGTMNVTYNFPNSVPAQDLVYVYNECSINPTAQSGTYVCHFSTECWTSGPHVLSGEGDSCTGEKTLASITVTVNSKPTVTLSPSGPDANGIVTFTVGWEFPNTTSHLDRALYVVRDGCCTDLSMNQGPATESGSVTFTEDTSCWPKGEHTWVATAFATTCNRESDTKQQTLTLQGGTPSVHVTLVQNGQTASGDPSYDAQVDWTFPQNTTQAQRTVTLACVSGQCPPGLPAGIPATNASGSATVTIGAITGYTLLTATATNSKCSPALTAKDSAGIGGCCPAGSVGTPVLVATGSVQTDETDPLPQQNVLHLSQAYDSDNPTQGLFGVGWTSLLDSSLTTHGSGSDQVVVITTESHMPYMFYLVGSQYTQLWPKGRNASATLSGNSSAGWAFREAGSQTVRSFSGAGRLLKITSLRERRDLTISYDGNSLPTRIDDSWGNVALLITTDSTNRLITQIAVDGRPDILWTYQYSSNLLMAVLAPDGQPWRRYTYDSGHLSTINDPLGNLIESHSYDANGRGITSVQAADDVQNVAFNLAGRVAGETLTQVSYASGRTVSYYVRGTSGVVHTVEVRGGCSSCARSEDVTYTFDAFNHVIREQDGRGYVRQSAYDAITNQLISVAGPYQPSGCDPQTDTNHCRMTTDDLAAASLTVTSLTKTTTYAYGDGNWPDLPTLVTTTSVANPSDVKIESFVYDAQTGVALTRTETGWTSSSQQETHTTTTALYNGTEGAAFTPGGPFNSSWLTLAQPPGLRKTIDGPRTDVSDLTTFVYYPLDSSVPATWRGRLAAARNALGQVTTYSNYDVFGNAQTSVDPNAVVVNATFDTLGRLLTTTFPAISGCDTVADPTCNVDIVSARSYSSGGGPLSTETRPRGGVTSYTYDTRGRIASITRTVSSTLSERIEYDYDPATGQKSAERTLDNSTGSFLVRKSVAYSYDTEGHLTQVQYPDAAKTVYTYDVAGALATTQDENHAAPNTFYDYNETGAIRAVRQTLGTGQISTAYGYDPQGNLITVTDPNGNLTTYTYDDFGRMTRQVSPVTGTTTYGYDLAGDILTTADANGATTTRIYDALSRVTSGVSSRSGITTETIAWTYDSTTAGAFGIGRLAGTTFPAGSTTYAYERRGLLRSEQSTLGGALYGSSYTYDADGDRISIGYPSGDSATYTFDLAGRQTSMPCCVTSAQYLPFGPLTSLSYTNGTTKTMQYDSRYRITENKLTSASGTIADYTYSEDPAGNITAIHDATDPTYNRDFTYDDLNRLVTANSGTSLWGTGSYAYDAMGNLTSRSLGTPPPPDDGTLSLPGRHLHPSAAVTGVVDTLAFTYNSTTPQISVATKNGIDHTVRYDAVGNETSYFASRTYSPRNLLASVADASGEGTPHTISYGYDARGVRVTRSESPTSSGAANRYFTYLPELQLVAVTDDDSSNIWASGHASIMSAPVAPSREFGYFDGVPIAEFGPPRTPDNTPLATPRRHTPFSVATTLFYTFTDHLGTPILQTDSSGTVVWRAEHEPYGNIWKMRTGSRTDQPLRLPGQDLAMTWEGTEENYNVFRWYRAGWGRYTQADPISLAMGMNLFRYATDDPLSYSDPLGLVAWSQNAPVYHGVDQDTVFKNCGDPSALGCTIPHLHALCTCRCSVTGSFQASVEMSMSIDVWARNDDRRASLFQIMDEEKKHVLYDEVMFKWAVKRGELLESKSFSSKKGCDSACQDFYSATAKDFTSNWVHKYNPHPTI
jgi:RHS repeat-associated protein